jgi:sulfotransferase family protein
MTTSTHTADSPMPNLFIVGAAKSGTTSLHVTLDDHPDVYMSPFKEPHFFSRPAVDARHAAHFRQITAEDTYRGLFLEAGDAAIIGESSTSYLWEAGACRRIAERCPSAKIVICLRDPVERAFSHYLDNVRDGLERREFSQALADEHLHGADWLTGYLDVGRYAGQVHRYVDTFQASVFVLYFERLVKDPEAELRRLVTFLDLDCEKMPGWELASANRHAAARNALSARVLESGLVRSAASIVPAGVRARAYVRLTRPSERPQMPADAREWLTEQYADEARRLTAITGHAPPWRWASPADLAVSA